jgi:hypothetical protein
MQDDIKVFYTGRYWQYTVKGVIQRDRGYPTERMARSAAKRAVKRRVERDREGKHAGRSAWV